MYTVGHVNRAHSDPTGATPLSEQRYYSLHLNILPGPKRFPLTRPLSGVSFAQIWSPI